MKIKELKDYFDYGIVKEISLVVDPIMPGNWMVLIEMKNGDCGQLETALGKPKSFASLDTAVSQVQDALGRVNGLRVAFNG